MRSLLSFQCEHESVYVSSLRLDFNLASARHCENLLQQDIKVVTCKDKTMWLLDIKSSQAAD